MPTTRAATPPCWVSMSVILVTGIQTGGSLPPAAEATAASARAPATHRTSRRPRPRPRSVQLVECRAQTSSGGVQIDLEIKTRPIRTRLYLAHSMLGRGHVLAFPGARPLRSRPMASACRAMCVATWPRVQSGSLLGARHWSSVTKIVSPSRRCVAVLTSRAAFLTVWPEMQRRSCPYRSARPKGAGGLNAIHSQLCRVSAGTHDVLRDRPSRRSGRASTTCKTFHLICHVTR